MELITVNEQNLDREHICCAISDKKGECRVSSKKAWIKERFADGLVFRKLDARGKVFIEYLPAEHAWCPIEAQGYFYIDCFWVSGQFQGQGYANQLLDSCIEDAKSQGKQGLCVLSSKKKMPFLSDPDYLKHRGFLVADQAAPYFELLYLPLTEDAPAPKFRDCARAGTIAEPGLVLYYTNQCPHTAQYVPLIQKLAEEAGRSLTVCKIGSSAEAQNAPSPFTTYSFFYQGKFVTNEILSEKKFSKFLSEHAE